MVIDNSADGVVVITNGRTLHPSEYVVDNGLVRITGVSNIDQLHISYSRPNRPTERLYPRFDLGLER